MNELQIEQRPNAPRISVPLCVLVLYFCHELISLDRTSDASHTLRHPSITSAELMCTLAPPPFRPSGTSPVLSPPLVPPNVSARTALQKQANLRARRQQRYSRDESALDAAFRRPVEYERIFPPRPSMQYATKQLELRVNEAQARLSELRELLRDDATDKGTHEASLRARWMLERWITSAEKELPRISSSTGCSVSPDAPGPSTQNTPSDANLAYFFAHSPTRTTTSSMSKRRYSSRIEQPRIISKQNVEPPQLRKWPLTSTLREPMKLKAFPSTSYITDSKRSIVALPPHNPPSSPEPRHSHDVDLIPPLSEPSSPLQLDCISTSTFSAAPDTPLDDSRVSPWHGFAVIYMPSQPSDEELLAVLSAGMEAEPMPEYVSFLLNRLEPIGEGVILPGLSRKESTASSGFEFISRPSIDAYDYPFLPRSRLLVRRSMRFPPSARPRLGVLSGLRAVCEYSPPTSPSRSAAQEQASPRSGVFSKVRRSMTARVHP